MLHKVVADHLADAVVDFVIGQYKLAEGGLIPAPDRRVGPRNVIIGGVAYPSIVEGVAHTRIVGQYPRSGCTLVSNWEIDMVPDEHGSGSRRGLELLEFEWQFAPPDIFEERTELTWSERKFVVAEGKVTARFQTSGGPTAWPMLASELHQVVMTQFLAAQVLSHRAFTLSRPTFARLRPDGGRDLFVAAEPARMTLKMGRPDIRHTDAAGNVIYDSRLERTQRRRSIAELGAQHAGDPILDSILRSYGAAVNDPGNELVHLYEIRDALARLFGSARAACAALGISRSEWKRLGDLANDEPFTQGRHRGRHPRQLRDATEGELEEGRGIARKMVEGYLRHLAAGGQSPRG